MDQYMSYIHKSRYARWLPEENRREDWTDTVHRYVNFWVEKGYINVDDQKRLMKAIYDMDVMPSMRAMATAGKAL